MSHADIVLLIIGMAAGAIATVLAVAQLTCEHAESHWSLRATTVLLGILSAWSAIDCWEVWAGIASRLILVRSELTKVACPCCRKPCSGR